jgi:hypothetical protein
LVLRQEAGGRGQRAEGRGQRAEGRGQRAEGRGQVLGVPHESEKRYNSHIFYISTAKNYTNFIQNLYFHLYTKWRNTNNPS